MEPNKLSFQECALLLEQYIEFHKKDFGSQLKDRERHNGRGLFHLCATKKPSISLHDYMDRIDHWMGSDCVEQGTFLLMDMMRRTQKNHFILSIFNVHRAILVCCRLAEKYQEDETVHSLIWCRMGGIGHHDKQSFRPDVEEFHKMETVVLVQGLDWNILLAPERLQNWIAASKRQLSHAKYGCPLELNWRRIWEREIGASQDAYEIHRYMWGFYTSRVLFGNMWTCCLKTIQYGLILQKQLEHCPVLHDVKQDWKKNYLSKIQPDNDLAQQVNLTVFYRSRVSSLPICCNNLQKYVEQLQDTKAELERKCFRPIKPVVTASDQMDIEEDDYEVAPMVPIEKEGVPDMVGILKGFADKLEVTGITDGLPDADMDIWDDMEGR